MIRFLKTVRMNPNLFSSEIEINHACSDTLTSQFWNVSSYFIGTVPSHCDAKMGSGHVTRISQSSHFIHWSQLHPIWRLCSHIQVDSDPHEFKFEKKGMFTLFFERTGGHSN
jgi:hypothetical protein